jgi:hypothetical protein
MFGGEMSPETAIYSDCPAMFCSRNSVTSFGSTFSILLMLSALPELVYVLNELVCTTR